MKTIRLSVVRSLAGSLLVALMGMSLVGCGYTFEGGGSILPPDVKRVFIPRVENSTTETVLTDLVTESLRDRFDRFGVVTVTDEMSDSDAVLKARILKVRRNTGSVTSRTDTALQLDTTVTMAAELRRVTGPVLWRDLNLSVSKSFGSDQQVVVTTSPDFANSPLGAGDLAQLAAGGSREIARGQEEEAFNSIAEEIARTIYDSAVAPDF